MKPTSAIAVLLFSPLSVLGTEVSWCKDEGCKDCPSGISSTGPGYPQCVVYDSDVVFGGQGFKTGPGQIKFEPYGRFGNPCNGQPGAIMIRSPASANVPGCGDLIYHTQTETCSVPLDIEKTFLVQFCCGSGDCGAAGIPVNDAPGKRSAAGGGFHGAYLHYANGTVIQPFEVGSGTSTSRPKPGSKRQAPPPGCANEGNHGYVEGSWQQSRGLYYTTLETQIISATVGPFENDTTYDYTYNQAVEHTTTFDVSIGDPWSIIKLEFGQSWSSTNTSGLVAHVPVLKGQTGRIGFTPVYQCMEGSMQTCSGDGGKRTPNKRVCSPYTANGNSVQGDYKLVQSG